MKHRHLSPSGRSHPAATAALAAALLIGAPGAEAIVIDATLVSLGGASYRWDYILTNDGSLGAGVAVVSFDIGFPEPTITGWTEIGADGAAWDEYTFQVFTDDHFGADATLGGEIGVGESTAFSVTFDWSGALLPGSQTYNVYDPMTFDILETGSTTVASIPSPSTAALLWLPLLALLAPGLARKPGGASPIRE